MRTVDISERAMLAVRIAAIQKRLPRVWRIVVLIALTLAVGISGITAARTSAAWSAPEPTPAPRPEPAPPLEPVLAEPASPGPSAPPPAPEPQQNAPQDQTPVPQPPSRPFGTDPIPPQSGNSANIAPAAAPVQPPPSGPNNWTRLTNQPGFQASTPLLLTDGRVLVEDLGSTTWHLLTPDSAGSYANGTWSLAASTKQCYDTYTSATETWRPLYMASAVLPDGRVVAIGGEYNLALGGGGVWTNIGEIYDPVANHWTCLSSPSGWNQLGDAQSVVQPNGTFLLANALSSSIATLGLRTNTPTWSIINPTGRSADGTGAGTIPDYNNEEGWTLLPNGKVLTLEIWAFANNAAKYYNACRPI